MSGNRPGAAGFRSVAFLVVTVTLGGCAQPDGLGYARSILDRPLPAARESALRECAFLDTEITRQENAARLVPPEQLLPETALAIQKATQTNIAALKLRATRLNCPTSALAGSDKP